MKISSRRSCRTWPRSSASPPTSSASWSTRTPRSSGSWTARRSRTRTSSRSRRTAASTDSSSRSVPANTRVKSRWGERLALALLSLLLEINKASLPQTLLLQYLSRISKHQPRSNAPCVMASPSIPRWCAGPWNARASWAWARARSHPASSPKNPSKAPSPSLWSSTFLTQVSDSENYEDYVFYFFFLWGRWG